MRKREKQFCFWLLLCIVLLVVVVLLSLYVNPHNPSFSVEKFYVPAFDRESINVDPIDAIYFNIKLRNRNRAIGLYYDHPLNLTISYTSSLTNHRFIWHYSVPKFYQGNHHSRRLIDVIQMRGDGVDGPVWNQTVVADQQTGARFKPVVFFKVDIMSGVRFKLQRSHVKEVLMSAQVPVNSNTGAKVDEEGEAGDA